MVVACNWFAGRRRAWHHSGLRFSKGTGDTANHATQDAGCYDVTWISRWHGCQSTCQTSSDQGIVLQQRRWRLLESCEQMGMYLVLLAANFLRGAAQDAQETKERTKRPGSASTILNLHTFNLALFTLDANIRQINRPSISTVPIAELRTEPRLASDRRNEAVSVLDASDAVGGT